jgi:TPR repeat protein
LAIPYCEGTGVEQSNAKTAEWLEKAADQGDAKARRLLDEMAVSGLMSAI